jgi:hypothetical protein
MERNSVFDQIRSQPGVVIDKIYSGSLRPGVENAKANQSPWACKAVFQSLSALAKCLVMRMLFMEGCFLPSDLAEWASPSHGAKQSSREAFNELVSLNIVIQTEDSTHMESNASVFQYRFNPHFQLSLRAALITPMEPWSDYIPHMPLMPKLAGNMNNMNREALDRHSTDKWNEVLAVLVNLYPVQVGDKICMYVTCITIIDTILHNNRHNYTEYKH